MNRADLMGWFPKGPSEDAGKGLRPVTDADLRSMAPELLAVLASDSRVNLWLRAWAKERGYVRLDGVDVEALREDLKFVLTNARCDLTDPSIKRRWGAAKKRLWNALDAVIDLAEPESWEARKHAEAIARIDAAMAEGDTTK